LAKKLGPTVYMLFTDAVFLLIAFNLIFYKTILLQFYWFQMTQSYYTKSRHNNCVVVYTRTNRCESGSINVDEEGCFPETSNPQRSHVRSNRAITDNFRFSFSNDSSGSPLYNDNSRVYYTHKSACICKWYFF
jgi:hypothetical protein